MTDPVDIPLPDQQAVYKVTLKLPSFWADKPAIWFAQAEAQFDLCHIRAQKTKFNHVIASLDSKYAGEVSDIILAPPEDCYDKLKSELVARLSSTVEQRTRQILQEEELGDKKPSQFLRHLRLLAGSTNIPDPLLQTIWLQRLPVSVQTILLSQPTLALDQLAQLADKIMEVTGPTPLCLPAHVAALSPSPSSPAASDEAMARLTKLVEHLTLQVSALTQTPSAGSRSRSRFRSPNSSRRRSPSNDFQGDRTNNFVCYYHRRFKEDARRCTTPCSFKPSNLNDSQ